MSVRTKEGYIISRDSESQVVSTVAYLGNKGLSVLADTPSFQLLIEAQ